MAISKTLLGIAAIGLLGLGACTRDQNVFQADGEFYKGKARSERSDRANFVVEAGPVSASLDNARAAAKYEAVKYCVDYLGSSDIEWTANPDDPDESLLIDNDRLIASGRCIEP